MHIHHRFLLSLSVAGLAAFTAPAFAVSPLLAANDVSDMAAKAPDREPSRPSDAVPVPEEPDDMFGQLERQFADEESQLNAMKVEAQNRKDAGRLKAVEQMRREMMERKAMKFGELKAKLGEEGFARAQTKWQDRSKSASKGSEKQAGKADRANRSMAKKSSDRNSDRMAASGERSKSKDMKGKREVKKAGRGDASKSRNPSDAKKAGRAGTVVKPQSADRPNESNKKSKSKKGSSRGGSSR